MTGRLRGAALLLVWLGTAPATDAPKPAQALLDQGVAFGQAGRLDDAEAVLKEGVRRFPSDARFALELAGLAYRRQNPRATKAYLHEALRLNPAERYGNDFLGTLYLLDGNLPAALKMTTPAYRGLQGDEIPTVDADDGRVRIEAVSGTWDGVEGPFASLTGIEMAVVRLAAGARIELPIARGRTVFCYVVRGEAKVGETAAPAFNLVELSDGEAVSLSADQETVVLLGHADAIGEPVVAHGPFVMNTQDEIVQAIRDYQAGKFGGL